MVDNTKVMLYVNEIVYTVSIPEYNYECYPKDRAIHVINALTDLLVLNVLKVVIYEWHQINYV